jgi:diguanylate cyclase (GGDEF)-like protein
MEWEDEPPFGHEPWVSDDASPENQANPGSRRLDLLLPADEQTGAASTSALNIYLDAMIELVSRSGQPLSLLCITVDDTAIVRFLGNEGIDLIGRAVARCLRQETRTHDVVGCADVDADAGIPIFMVVCPLLNEEHAAHLAERLRSAMTANADPGRPWLTLSMGVAALSIDITDGRELMARAYAAMFRAQRKGGDRVWRSSDTGRAFMEQQEQEPPEGPH